MAGHKQRIPSPRKFSNLDNGTICNILVPCLNSNACMAGNCWLRIFGPERLQMQTLVSGDGSDVNQGDSTRPWNYFFALLPKGWCAHITACRHDANHAKLQVPFHCILHAVSPV